MFEIEKVSRIATILLIAVLGITKVYAMSESEIIELRSPNKQLTVKVFVESGRLSYTIASGNVEVLSSSPLGLTVDGVDLGNNPHLFSTPVKSKINEKYGILGNHPIAHNRANEVSIPFETSGKQFNLIIRIYNDGVGIRYTIPDDAGRIDGEATAWNIPMGVKKVAWMPFNHGYEDLSHVTSLNEVPQDKLITGPPTFELEGHYISISEADCETFADMALMRSGTSFKVAFPSAMQGWPIKRLEDNNPLALDGFYKGQKVSPWRTTIVARSLTDLVNSDLLMNLCPAPAAGSDFSWIKPGRCMWQWWSIGAPKYEDQKDWFDAAAKLKWEYYLIDDGWRNWKQDDKNQWELLKEVIEYGKSVGVESIVWVDSKEFRSAKPRREYLEKVKAIGATGIKIDFIPKATSEIMQWYMGTMQDCAELELLLNFHGSVKPTGLTRTYPNDITREAVYGNEFHMSRYKRVMPLQNDVCLPFTRLMAGAADITPVMLNPKELATALYTWAHQFAQAIVYLSPITHFCDYYKFYLESPMFDLFQEVPTVWDETKVLPCTEMGEVVAYARRKGNTWWIGVMNGEAEKEVEISLDFLKKPVNATLIYDDAQTTTSIDRREQRVSPKDVLTVKMNPGGGFVARL